jgi:hypothetical protein
MVRLSPKTVINEKEEYELANLNHKNKKLEAQPNILEDIDNLFLEMKG